MLSQLFLSFGSPWGFSHKHFKVDDTECPNIAFETVFIVIKSFRWHVNWTSNIVRRIFFRIDAFHSKTKVSNFNLMMWNEDIGRLEISVNDTVFRDLIVTINDLSHQLHGLIFRDCFSFVDKLCKIAFVTKFGNNVSIILCCVDIEKFKNVGKIFERFEDINLRGEEIFMDFSFDHFHVDDFDGDCLIWDKERNYL